METIIIEEHLEHWENPAMCIDPDKCPVVYASLMNEAEKAEEFGLNHDNQAVV